MFGNAGEYLKLKKRVKDVAISGKAWLQPKVKIGFKVHGVFGRGIFSGKSSGERDENSPNQSHECAPR